MVTTNDRRKLQALYPEPKARSGMAARKATVFTVPLIKLSALLFIPPYAILSAWTLYLYVPDGDRSAQNLYFFMCFAGLLVIGVLAVAMLLRAYAIVIRNCLRPFVITYSYLILALVAGWVLINWFADWTAGMSVGHALIGEAAIYFVIVLSVVLFAKQLSR